MVLFTHSQADAVTRVRARAYFLPLALCLLMLGCSNGRGSVESAQPPSSEQPPTTPPPSEPPPQTPPPQNPPPEEPPPSEPGEPPPEIPQPENPPPPPPPPGAFNIGGTITGLRGSTGLTLQLNDQQPTNNLFNGAFAFATPLPNGTAYTVAIAAQPTSPSQECVLGNATGTVSGANVTNISVVCTTRNFRVGGTITGLARSEKPLVLRNGTQELTITSNGAFRFPPQPSGSTYFVQVNQQPENPWQECSVARGEGTVGSGDIQDIRITCATRSYFLGGTVTGLQGGSVVLRNGSDTVEVQSDGLFTFPTRVASNGTYEVSVQRQPETPPQICSVDAPSGQVTNADVNSLVVRCSIRTFTVGGQVSGLVGTGLVLQNNGADDLAVSADGNFTFNAPIASGQTYSVSVATQPTSPAQVCTVTNPSGTVTTSNVTSVAVSCVRTEFTIGGTVTGLAGSGLVLQNNAGNNLAIAANGAFTFTGSVPTGTAYSVSVLTQPSTPTQECVVSNAAGAVGGDDVSNIAVSCTTSSFPITAVVTGVGGLFPFTQIRNGSDILNVFSNGTYEFPTRVLSGATYDVTVGGGTLSCRVSDGSGTVTNAPVTVQVLCGQ